MESVEMTIRHSMHHVGSVLLEKLVNADKGGYRGSRIDCGSGHRAKFIEYRSKGVTTVLGVVDAERAYYYCKKCCVGIIPKDDDLDIADTTLSPGVRRMMGRVGGKESFDGGRCDLKELADIDVTAKEVERVAESIGADIEAVAEQNRQKAILENVIPFSPAVPHFYITADGTGVPVVSKETQGRKGKDASGIAKTREAKLGAIFTQTTTDGNGHPVRDENSTTYVGAIETCDEFGKRIYAESVRRGMDMAEKVILLGDGASWIWGIAEEHFPHAIMVVDFYHAMEHVSNLAKLIHGSNNNAKSTWITDQRRELLHGSVDTVIKSMQRLKTTSHLARNELHKTIHYFKTNRLRMQYSDYRKQGLFIGSGVIEAGCRTIVGQRLKQSGMRWSVKGANSIISLRCCQISGGWENYWENRSAA